MITAKSSSTVRSRGTCLGSCLAVILVPVALFCIVQARIQLPVLINPLDISGACPPEQVKTFLSQSHNHVGPILLLLYTNYNGTKIRDNINWIEVERERERLSSRELPECLKAIGKEESIIAEKFISSVRLAKQGGYRKIVSLWTVLGISSSTRKIRDARNRINNTISE